MAEKNETGKYRPGMLQTPDKLLRVWFNDDGNWVEMFPDGAELAAWEYEWKEAARTHAREVQTPTD